VCENADTSQGFWAVFYMFMDTSHESGNANLDNSDIRSAPNVEVSWLLRR